MQANSYKVGPYDLSAKQHSLFLTFQSLINKEALKLFSACGDQIPLYTAESHLIRLLVAREFNTQQALLMWQKWVEWRQTYAAEKIQEIEIESELKSGKAFWHKKDKKNHPCLVVKTRRHHPAECDMKSMMKFVVYLIEKGTKLADELNPDGKICVLWDRKGFTMKNFDRRFLGMMKSMTGVLQDNYAERMDSVYILNPNWFFKAMFKITRPFLNQKTKDKIKIISKQAELLKYFDSDCLLKDMGGTSDFVYKYKNWVVRDEDGEEPKDEDLKEATKEIMKEEGLKEDAGDSSGDEQEK